MLVYARSTSQPTRHAFTLVEVMFAVITLGIGLILIAAMFPVAIQQTKMTGEESQGAGLARAAELTVQAIAQSPAVITTVTPSVSITMFPPTALPSATQYSRGLVYPLRFTGQIDSRLLTGSGNTASSLTWDAVKGNVISPSDPRYAWVPLYRRDGLFGTPASWSGSTQLILIPVKVRNTSAFVPNDVSPANSGLGMPFTSGSFVAANLEPRYVKVTSLTPTTAGTNANTITFTSPSSIQAEGAYVVIANDNKTDINQGWMNGRIYRLGTQTDTAGTWNLAPGFDYPDDNGADGSTKIGTLSNFDAYMIGGGFDSPSAPSTLSGPAMDVAAYAGFISTY